MFPEASPSGINARPSSEPLDITAFLPANRYTTTYWGAATLKTQNIEGFPGKNHLLILYKDIFISLTEYNKRQQADTNDAGSRTRERSTTQ
jgi:hypothetical protein